ncbi:hypothetical protein MKW94_001298, partial [Papaver nudicaule]|nr:hypothetical protein [Papaver nudicaule]
ARGLKKHLKRLNAPKHWMLDKLGGAFAPKPSYGPHKHILVDRKTNENFHLLYDTKGRFRLHSIKDEEDK